MPGVWYAQVRTLFSVPSYSAWVSRKISFCLASMKSVKTYLPDTMSCHFITRGKSSGALSHTLTMSPRKHVRMHNPENIAMHIAFRFFFLKKKPTLNDDEHSPKIWQKKKEKETRKKGKIRTNLLCKQKIIKKNEIEQVRSESCTQKKKIDDEQIYSMMSKSILKECQLSKKGSSSTHSRTLPTSGLSFDFMAESKVFKASLWPEEPLTALFIVQAPQDCEVPSQDWSQRFCPVRFEYVGRQSVRRGSVACWTMGNRAIRSWQTIAFSSSLPKQLSLNLEHNMTLPQPPEHMAYTRSFL